MDRGGIERQCLQRIRVGQGGIALADEELRAAEYERERAGVFGGREERNELRRRDDQGAYPFARRRNSRRVFGP